MEEMQKLNSPLFSNQGTNSARIQKTQKTKLAEEDAVFSEASTYEEAVSAAGFGKYNILLLIGTLPTAVAAMCSTTSISFILSEAQCDLSLTLQDKGLLNAITFFGMISSAIFWGMVGASRGRRTVLLYSCVFDGAVCFLGALSSQKWIILVTKFISGFMMSGSVALHLCYLSEFHSTALRPILVLIVGIYHSLGRVLIPLFAWALLPMKLDLKIIDGLFELKSWQLYLLLCSCPSIIAGIINFHLSETPKFLMTKGRYDEAITILRTMYSWNTGNPPKSFPISELTDETFEAKSLYNVVGDKRYRKTKIAMLHDAIRNVKPLFMPPFLSKTFLISGILFGGLLGGNTYRLWFPQLLITINGYIQTHNGSEDATLCQMLDYSPKLSSNTTTNISTQCIVPEVSDDVYINNTIIPSVCILGFIIAAIIVKKIGKKYLLVGQYCLSCVLMLANYWARNLTTVVVLSTFYLTFFSVSVIIAISVSVELYPTHLRSQATSLFVFCGRVGSVVGNALFPVLLHAGCLPPFLFLAGFMFICTVLSLMLPGTENKPLK